MKTEVSQQREYVWRVSLILQFPFELFKKSLKDLKIPIKIGFQAEFSSFLYSIIIESKSIGFLEDSYQTIEKILGME